MGESRRIPLPIRTPDRNHNSLNNQPRTPTTKIDPMTTSAAPPAEEVSGAITAAVRTRKEEVVTNKTSSPKVSTKAWEVMARKVFKAG